MEVSSYMTDTMCKRADLKIKALFGNAYENMKRTKGVTLTDGDLYYLNDHFNYLNCVGKAEKPIDIIQRNSLLERFTWEFKKDREIIIKTLPEKQRLDCKLAKTLFGNRRSVYDKWQEVDDPYYQDVGRIKALVQFETNILILGPYVPALLLARRISTKFGQVILDVETMIQVIVTKRPRVITYETLLDKSVRTSYDVRITGLEIKEAFLDILKSEVIKKCGYIMVGLHMFLRFVKKHGNKKKYDENKNQRLIDPVDIVIKLKADTNDFYRQLRDLAMDPFGDTKVFKKIYYQGLHTMEEIRRKLPKDIRYSHKYLYKIGQHLTFDEALLSEHEELKAMFRAANKKALSKRMSGFGIENLCKEEFYLNEINRTTLEFKWQYYTQIYIEKLLNTWDARYILEMESYLPSIFHLHNFIKRFGHCRIYRRPYSLHLPFYPDISNTLKYMIHDDIYHQYLITNMEEFKKNKSLISFEIINSISPPILTHQPAFYNKYVSNISEWECRCPVSFYEHDYGRGKWAYLARLQDKIYFLADERKLRSFIADPEKYLAPPFPIAMCRVIVTGHKCSGKSYIAEAIATFFKAKLLQFSDILEKYYQIKFSKYKNYMKNILEKILLKAENDKIIMDYYTDEAAKLKKVFEWLLETYQLVHYRYNSMLFEKRRKSRLCTILETDSGRRRHNIFSLKYLFDDINIDLESIISIYKDIAENVNYLVNSGLYLHVPSELDLLSEKRYIRAKFLEKRLNFYNSFSYTQKYCEQPIRLYEYLPDEYLPSNTPEPLTKVGQIQNLNKKIDFILKNQPCQPLSSHEIGQAIMSEIVEIEQNVRGNCYWYGGWVLDGVILDPVVWLSLQDHGLLPYNIIYMRDPDLQYNRNIYLQEFYSNKDKRKGEIYDVLRYYKEDKTYIRDTEEMYGEGGEEMQYDDTLDKETVDRGDIGEAGPIDIEVEGEGDFEDETEESDEDEVKRDIQREFLQDYLSSKYCVEQFYDIPCNYLSWYDESELQKLTITFRNEQREKDKEATDKKKIMRTSLSENQFYSAEWLLDPEIAALDQEYLDRQIYLISVMTNLDQDCIVERNLTHEGPYTHVPFVLDQIRGGPGAPKILDTGEKLSEEIVRDNTRRNLRREIVPTRDLNDMCSVKMKEGKRVQGTIRISFMNEEYWLCTPVCFRKFRSNPNDYLTIDHPNNLFPQIKICISGPPGSGAHLLAKEIAYYFGLRYIDALEEVNCKLLPPGFLPVGFLTENQRDKRFMFFEDNASDDIKDRLTLIRNYVNREDRLPSRYLKQLIGQKWNFNEGFVYHNMPYNRYDLKYMIKKDFQPDIIICVDGERKRCFNNIIDCAQSNWYYKLTEYARKLWLDNDSRCRRWMEINNLRFYKICKVLLYDNFPETFKITEDIPLVSDIITYEGMEEQSEDERYKIITAGEKEPFHRTTLFVSKYVQDVDEEFGVDEVDGGGEEEEEEEEEEDLDEEATKVQTSFADFSMQWNGDDDGDNGEISSPDWWHDRYDLYVALYIRGLELSDATAYFQLDASTQFNGIIEDFDEYSGENSDYDPTKMRVSGLENEDAEYETEEEERMDTDVESDDEDTVSEDDYYYRNNYGPDGDGPHNIPKHGSLYVDNNVNNQYYDAYEQEYYYYPQNEYSEEQYPEYLDEAFEPLTQEQPSKELAESISEYSEKRDIVFKDAHTGKVFRINLKTSESTILSTMLAQPKLTTQAVEFELYDASFVNLSLSYSSLWSIRTLTTVTSSLRCGFKKKERPAEETTLDTESSYFDFLEDKRNDVINMKHRALMFNDPIINYASRRFLRTIGIKVEETETIEIDSSYVDSDDSVTEPLSPLEIETEDISPLESPDETVLLGASETTVGSEGSRNQLEGLQPSKSLKTIDKSSLISSHTEKYRKSGKMVRFSKEVGVILSSDEEETLEEEEEEEEKEGYNFEYGGEDEQGAVRVPPERKSILSMDVHTYYRGFQLKDSDNPVYKSKEKEIPCLFSYNELILAEMMCPVNEEVDDVENPYIIDENTLACHYLELYNIMAIEYLDTARSHNPLSFEADYIPEWVYDKEDLEYMEKNDTEELKAWRECEYEIDYYLYNQRTLMAISDTKPQTELGRAMLDFNFNRIIKYLFRTGKLKRLNKVWEQLNGSTVSVNVNYLTKYYQNYEIEMIKIKEAARDYELNSLLYRYGNDPIGRIFEVVQNNIIISENFEKVNILNEEDVDSLLQDGYYTLSKFGRTCPVMLFENRAIGTGDIYHLLFRRHIYFVDSYQSKDKFVNNPLKYICQNSYRVPPWMKALIAGYPLSLKEKSGLILYEKYGFPYIVMSEAVGFILTKMTWSLTSDIIHSFACFHEPLPYFTAMKCADVMLHTMIGYPIGWTLVSVGLALENVIMMEYYYLFPEYLFFMYPTDLDSYEYNLYRRMSLIKQNPESYKFGIKEHTAELEFSSYSPVEDSIVQYFCTLVPSYGYVYIINNVNHHRLIKIIVTYLVEDNITKGVYYLQLYHLRTAIPIKYFISSNEKNRLPDMESIYRNACPLCAYELSYLTEATEQNYLRFLVRFGESIVWLCPEHYLFMSDPDIKSYLKENVWKVVCDTIEARKMILESDESDVGGEIPELEGYCPICLANISRISNRKYVKGKRRFTVYYAEKFYFCCSDVCATIFLKSASIYAIQTVDQLAIKMFDREVPESPFGIINNQKILDSLKVTSFYMYIHELSDILYPGLCELDAVRPVYKGMGIAESACIFLAYYLLSHGKVDDLILKVLGIIAYTEFYQKCKTYATPKSLNECDMLRQKYNLLMNPKKKTIDDKLREFKKMFTPKDVIEMSDLKEMEMENYRLKSERENLLFILQDKNKVTNLFMNKSEEIIKNRGEQQLLLQDECILKENDMK